MEIACVEKSKNRLVIKIIGGGHTICSILKDELKDIPEVKTTSYRINHPLVGEPQMMIETNGKKSPENALKAAIKNIAKKADNLKKSVAKAIK